MSNWNVLAPFESGDLTIDAGSRQVHYRVSIRELVLLGTGMVGLMTVFLLAPPSHPPLLLMPLMWLWLVGANLALGIFQFKRFVGHALGTAPHLTGQSAWTNSWQK